MEVAAGYLEAIYDTDVTDLLERIRSAGSGVALPR